MSNYQQSLHQIPIPLDWNAIVMLMGIIQGILMVLVIAIRSKTENQSIRILGLLILFLSISNCQTTACPSGFPTPEYRRYRQLRRLQIQIYFLYRF